MNNLYKKVKQNAQCNFDDIMKVHLQMSPEKILERIYHLNFVNEWYQFLMSGLDQLTLDTEVLAWLAGFDKPIDKLYEYFLECDDAPHYDWYVMYEWLVTLKDEEEN